MLESVKHWKLHETTTTHYFQRSLKFGKTLQIQTQHTHTHTRKNKKMTPSIDWNHFNDQLIHPLAALNFWESFRFSALSELRIDCVFGGAIGGTTYIALVSCEQRATKKTCLGVLFLCKSADRNCRYFKGNQLISYQTAFFELNTNDLVTLLTY